MANKQLNIDTRMSNGISVGSHEDFFPEFSFKYDTEDAVPDEGEMTIRYCITRKDEDAKRPEDERYSCTVEVKEIISAKSTEPESPTGKYNDAGDALDKLAAEKADANEE